MARHWAGTIIVCRSSAAAISVKVRNYFLAVMAVETSDSVSLHFEKIIRQGLERLSEILGTEAVIYLIRARKEKLESFTTDFITKAASSPQFFQL